MGGFVLLGVAAAAWAAGRSWVAAPLGLGWVLGLCLAWVCSSGWVLLRRLGPPVRVWVGCAAWVWWEVLHTYVGDYLALIIFAALDTALVFSP